MFDHEKECFIAHARVFDVDPKFIESTVRAMPEVKRMNLRLDDHRDNFEKLLSKNRSQDRRIEDMERDGLRARQHIDRLSSEYAELHRGLIEASQRIEALEKLHGK
jgi:predicted RNase H-like nuclease (RuvC/YqgF family)